VLGRIASCVEIEASLDVVADLAIAQRLAGHAHVSSIEVHFFFDTCPHSGDSQEMWTPNAIQALRLRLGLDLPGFAKLMGVDTRSVTRWEQGVARPTGASEAVLSALQEKLQKDPADAERVIAFLVGAVAVGGLAYLLVKLLDEVPDSPGRKARNRRET
jgi:DNA-binding transcriptional regulator YiaG